MITRALIVVSLFASSAVYAETCSGDCTVPSGGGTPIESARSLMVAGTAMDIASATFGAVSLVFAGGNALDAGKGVRGSYGWHSFSFGISGAAIVLGSINLALGINLRNLASDVFPPENYGTVRTSGNVSVAIGAATIGAGVLNAVLGVVAYVLPPDGETSVTTASFNVLTIPTRDGSLAVGLGLKANL